MTRTRIFLLSLLVAKGSRIVHYTTFGCTFEGRALPLAVVGRVADASPRAVRASGKLRVYIQANIHAGEVEGKEATQALVRDIAAGQHSQWLDSMVLLVAPIYNADGNERVALTNRGPQNGPLGGMGTRANAQASDCVHMEFASSVWISRSRFRNSFVLLRIGLRHKHSRNIRNAR